MRHIVKGIFVVNVLEFLNFKGMEELMNTHPNFYEWRHLEQNQEPVTAWSPRVDPEARSIK